MHEFQIVLSPHAVKDLAAVGAGIRGKIVKALQTLKEDPFPRGRLVKKIKGTKADYYRLRVDKHRVFYMIEGNQAVILRIIGRKDAARFIGNPN